jgi:hypothetical protein
MDTAQHTFIVTQGRMALRAGSPVMETVPEFCAGMTGACKKATSSMDMKLLNEQLDMKEDKRIGDRGPILEASLACEADGVLEGSRQI